MRQGFLQSLAIVFLSILLISLFFGCGFMFGINHVKDLSSDQVKKEADKLGIETKNLYLLNAPLYLEFVKIQSGSDSIMKKDLLQPLQFLFFDGEGKVAFHLVNCYVGGFPNLKWNRNGSFNEYPPSQSLSHIPDRKLKLTHLDSCLVTLSQTRAKPLTAPCLVIFWNYFMGRQSKKLIALVNNYRKQVPQGVSLYFVNNDELFYQLSTIPEK